YQCQHPDSVATDLVNHPVALVEYELPRSGYSAGSPQIGIGRQPGCGLAKQQVQAERCTAIFLCNVVADIETVLSRRSRPAHFHGLIFLKPRAALGKLRLNLVVRVS